MKHEPEICRVGFGLLNRKDATKLLEQLRRSGFERCNFVREGAKRITLKSASVISHHADALLEGNYHWTGVSYPKKEPLTEEELILLRMMAP